VAAYDAIVIGAGHNGLTCAAYLARAGLRVLVLERSGVAGGACVTEELWPGYRMSTAAYSLSLLQPQVVADLGLEIDVRPRDPVYFAPFSDGGGLVIPRDRRAAHEAIAQVSTSDADAYGRWHELFAEAATRLQPFLTYPATRKQVRRAFRRSEMEGLFERTVDGAIADVCEEYFESDVMRGLVSSQGITGTAGGPRTPGTSYVFLHHASGRALGELGSWGFVRGGMGSVTQALTDAVRAAGGDIRLEAEVSSISLDSARRVSGVALGSGEEIEATTVCSNADPKRTLQLLPPSALPREFIEDVELLPSTGTVVKVNCALSGLPKFRGMSNGNNPGPEHLGMITVAPSIDYLEKACRAAAEGLIPEEFFCEAWIQTASEDGLAPEGKHTLSIFAQYAPYDPAESTWDDVRETVGDRVIATLERYAPGLTDLIEHRIVLGPRDLEARFGLTGGNIFHGELLPEWIFDRRPANPWHRHRLPVPGMYLCGSGAHPGGGVSGGPGRIAARAVLEDAVARGGLTEGPAQ
jgi:phytoene dehydrogenase-like protein